MCEYCIEQLMMADVSNAMSVKHILDISRFYASNALQEYPDIHAVLEVTSPEMARNETAAQVICCRGLEILLNAGFASKEYQHLLQLKAFHVALKTFTDDGLRAHRFSKYPYFGLSKFHWVRDVRSFTQPTYLEDQLGQFDASDATRLFKWHNEFFRNGAGQIASDPNENLLPIEEGMGASTAFRDLFPVFWCALNLLGRQNPQNPLLWGIVCENQFNCSDIDSFDLWIQRRAALFVYDQQGIAPFQKNLKSIRPELFQFIALVRHVSNEERSSLLAAFNQISTEYWGDYFDIRAWLEKGKM